MAGGLRWRAERMDRDAVMQTQRRAEHAEVAIRAAMVPRPDGKAANGRWAMGAGHNFTRLLLRVVEGRRCDGSMEASMGAD